MDGPTPPKKDLSFSFDGTGAAKSAKLPAPFFDFYVPEPSLEPPLCAGPDFAKEDDFGLKNGGKSEFAGRYNSGLARSNAETNTCGLLAGILAVTCGRVEAHHRQSSN